MYCPSCGHDAEGAKFCPECGNDLALLMEPRVCSACGTEVAGAKFCPECGQEVGSARTSQRGASRPAAGRAAEDSTAREPNGSRPEGPSGRRNLHLITAVAVAAIAVVVLVVLVAVRGPGDGSAVATEAVPVGGNVQIPLQDLAGGAARFYTYDVAGVTVRFFVMQSSDGQYRSAFDASKECGPFKKGFRQEGTDMVCNKCGQKFAAVGINVLTGGCNPASIDRKVSGETLVLKAEDIERGVQYFQ